MAHGHAGWITRTKGVELTAVADIDAGRASEFAAKFSVPRVFTDFGKLLDEAPVDAVVEVVEVVDAEEVMVSSGRPSLHPSPKATRRSALRMIAC